MSDFPIDSYIPNGSRHDDDVSTVVDEAGRSSLVLERGFKWALAIGVIFWCAVGLIFWWR